MGPFGIPWLTFAAVLVTLGTVVAAVLWAIFAKPAKGDEDEG